MDKPHKDFLASHGIKSTSQRNLVLDLLHETDHPVSAETIYFRASEVHPSVNLSTIYRILELFVSKDIVIKNMLSDSKKTIYELNTNTHKHYMVCLKCKRIFPLENCPCSLIEKTVSEHSDFEIMDHKLEIMGYCSNCK
ncbi:Fur family transcriptional regulator [Cellulosilyticum sp. I15G10I2]|uniref:Fur family transcriptional regulator n=1 Tax=Cellulosilyticum sp. I15G10I2 TaxID=1892843 RepID=UPI00085BFD85|nr:transcriptional repressor [Cellulosilyticum sp. I15G10I2]